MKAVIHKSLLPLVLVSGVILYNFLTYFSHDVIGGFEVLFNSDSLYLPTLFKDLFVDGNNYSNWYLTPAPYFFPDMGIYFLSAVIAPEPYVAVFLFFNLQLIILYIALYKIYNLYSPENASLYSVVSIVLLYCLPFFSASLLIRSGHHYGVFLAGVWMLYFVVKAIKNGEAGHVDLLFLLGITTLIVASDKLVLVQFVLPLIATLACGYIYKKVSFRLFGQLSLILFLAVILGYLIHDVLVINKTEYEVTYGIENIHENYVLLLSSIVRTLTSNVVYGILLISFYVYSVIQCVVTFIFRKNNSCPLTGMLFLFINVSIICLLAVLLLSNLAMVDRYLMPLYFFPLCFLPLMISTLDVKNWLKTYKKLLAAILVLVLLAVNYMSYKTFSLKTDYYPKYAQCIDEFVRSSGKKTAISTYWPSKHLTMLSKEGLKVVQVTNELNYYDWITTKSWREDSYDMVIIDKRENLSSKIDIDLATSKAGLPPLVSKHCGRYELVLFAGGIRVN